jgi:hypothetical protein
LCSHSIVPQHFMEPIGSLPSSQELSTCTYPEPDQSSPQHSILPLKRSILMLSIYLCLGLPSGLFPSGFLTNNLYTFLFSPIRATCPAHFILCLYNSNYTWRRVQLNSITFILKYLRFYQSVLWIFNSFCFNSIFFT